MITWVAGLRLGEERFSRPLGGVGVQAIPDAGLDTTRCVESVCKVPPCVSVLQLLVPGVGVGIFIIFCGEAGRVAVMHWVISAMRELFKEDVSWSTDLGL
jgi:hypothetical protein